eukprot:4165992-Pyramimonas_sp.AAC.1
MVSDHALRTECFHEKFPATPFGSSNDEFHFLRVEAVLESNEADLLGQIFLAYVWLHTAVGRVGLQQ